MNIQQKKKKKTIIYLISGLIAIAGIGTVTYLVWPKKETKTETTQPQERKAQHFQKQLTQIKATLNTLNQNITKTKSSLSQKKTEQTQSPQNNSLSTEINQLEQQLTTYETQKQKLETIIPKLEEQIKNLGKENSEKEQEKIIQELEQEIKEVNKELGIKEEPEEKKDDKKPRKDDKPSLPKDKKNNPEKKPETPQEKNDNPDDKKPSEDKKDDSPQETPNSSESQNLRKNAKILSTELEKLTKWMNRHLNDSELRLGIYLDQITNYLDTIKNQKKVLENFTDYTDVSLIKETIENTLKVVWKCIGYLHCKMPADFMFHSDQEAKTTDFIKTSSPKLKEQIENQNSFDIDSQVSFTKQLICKYDEIYKEVYEKKSDKPDSDTDDDISDELPSDVDRNKIYQILREVAEKLKKEIDNVNDDGISKPITNIDLKAFSDSVQEYFLKCNDGQQKELIKKRIKKIETVLQQAENVLGGFSKHKKLEKIAKKKELIRDWLNKTGNNWHFYG